MRKFALCLTALAFVLSANAQKQDTLYVVKHDNACAQKAECDHQTCQQHAESEKKADCCEKKEQAAGHECKQKAEGHECEHKAACEQKEGSCEKKEQTASHECKHEAACEQKEGNCEKKEQAAGHECKHEAAANGGVPYTIARNYFVRNDAKFQGSKLIKNAEDFQAIFGKAAVMGENGTPTPIDFDKQFVLAIVRPETNVNTQITPNTLTADDNELKFNYNILQGRSQGHNIVPALILIIDREYLRQNINVSSRVKHLTIEDDPDAVLQGVYD